MLSFRYLSSSSSQCQTLKNRSLYGPCPSQHHLHFSFYFLHFLYFSVPKLVFLLFYCKSAADSSTFRVSFLQTKQIQSPTYDRSTYNFPTLQWCDSDTRSVEICLQILNFDLFLAQQYVVGYSANAGQGQQAMTPVSHMVMRVNI